MDDAHVATLTGVGSGMSVAILDAAGDYAATIVSGANLHVDASALCNAALWQDVGLLILDELNIALRYDYLDLDTVLADLGARRGDLHVIVTGRNAKDELIEIADLVTEMTEIKHPFRAGVKAQAGIEF